MKNCEVIDLKNMSFLSFDEFCKKIENTRLVNFFGFSNTLFLLVAKEKNLFLYSTTVETSFPSLTPTYPAFHLFERVIFEDLQITPTNHPWLKPVRSIDNVPFLKVNSEMVHEVAVGPVHAGIIEPGHFRFQCFGEDVLNLEIALGYQHRGVEKALIGGPNERTIHYMETLAGDTTIGHTLAYCQAIEALSFKKIPIRAEFIRAIALELERLANHTGDLGALANDVGYLPTSSYCGRLRGEFLNMTALICGNRFGRGLLTPGGVNFDLDPSLISELKVWLEKAFKDVQIAANLLWNSSFVMERFEKAGKISKKIAKDLGLTGPAARSCGLLQDVRRDFPMGIYQKFEIPIPTLTLCDVYARAYLRFLEIQNSFNYINLLLDEIPSSSILTTIDQLKPNAITCSLAEGFRGEICHTVITDEKANFALYKIIDPSFHNWQGLSCALKDEQIFNFPLCNKSFNLSYCGVDL